MGISDTALKSDLTAIVGADLATQLVDSYVEMQRRYFSGDWKPSELDGGQFCEAVARAMYFIDTGTTTTDLPGRIADHLLDKGKQHKLTKEERDHFCRVLQTVYRFRNDRGVAHISSTFTANYADATLVGTAVKWMFAEFLRLSWNNDRDKVAEIIETITQIEHPLIHEIDGKPLVLSAALSAPEEILVLLNRSSSGRLSRDDLKAYVRSTPSAISTAVSRMIDTRELRVSDAGEIVITPIGEKRVREQIMPRLQNGTGRKQPARRKASRTTRRKAKS